MQEIQNIAVASLLPSPTNPRKHFDEAGLQELATSLRQHGMLQPVLVRPLPHGRFILDHGVMHAWKKTKKFWQVLDRTLLDGGRYTGPQPVQYATEAEAQLAMPEYELIAGERRWRAAQLAGLKTLPAIVREMPDLEAIEIQVVENLQRADLHPMEEAEGYQALQDSHGLTVDDIAAKTGKSRAYIYGRLKLTALCADGRELFKTGKLTASVALLIARIPDVALQASAIKDICFDYNGDPASTREVASEIERYHMKPLGDAPFSPKDAKLLPEAGPCTTCPKRSGANPDLFSDVESADVCTDPKCFAAKKEAFLAKRIATAQATGQTVLDAETAKKLFSYGSVRHDAAYVAADSYYSLGGLDKPWKKALGKKAPPVVLAVNDRDELVELYPKDEAIEAAKKLKLPMSEGRVAQMQPVDRKEVIRANKLARAQTAVIGANLLGVVGGLQVDELLALALLHFTQNWKFRENLLKRLVPDRDADVDPTVQTLAKALQAGTPFDTYLVVAQAWLQPKPDEWDAGAVDALADVLGVDVAAIKARVEAEFNRKK